VLGDHLSHYFASCRLKITENRAIIAISCRRRSLVRSCDSARIKRDEITANGTRRGRRVEGEGKGDVRDGASAVIRRRIIKIIA